MTQAGKQKRGTLAAEVRAMERLMGRGLTSNAYVLTRAARRLAAWTEAAREGNPDAQVLLASCLEDGIEGEKDDNAALAWHRRAADQGHAFGQFAVGWMIAHGRGVPVDLAEAGRWYRLAAEQGQFCALTHLGSWYEQGKGV